jgi:HD-like signal output (HDOD) protein
VALPAPLRSLQADLPACPRVLLELQTLMRDDERALPEIAALIESDMALAAAVVRTVNSAMYGLLRRVETVGEALRYLGTREVVAISHASALRAAFPPSPRMNVLWRTAGLGGLLMGRSAAALGVDPLQAHTAGLFAHSGQALMLAHLGPVYATMLETFGHDAIALDGAETRAWGIGHAAYGSVLCASWGLAAPVVSFVRERVRPPAQRPALEPMLRRLLALGAATEALLHEDGGPGEPAALSVLSRLPASADLPEPALRAAVAPHWHQLGELRARGLQIID